MYKLRLPRIFRNAADAHIYHLRRDSEAALLWSLPAGLKACHGVIIQLK